MKQEETIVKHLKALRLPGFRSALQEQQQEVEYASYSFEERLEIVLSREIEKRHQNRTYRLLREAHLRENQACMEEIDYNQKRSLRQEDVREFRGTNWLESHHNILITGASGVGKTYIACAIGNQACRNGYRVLYYRLPELSESITMSRIMGDIAELRKKLYKAALLILDDFGLYPLQEKERYELFELIENRYHRASTIICTHVPIDKWDKIIGDPGISDGICDRFIHRAHRLQITGESMRKKEEVKDSKN